MLNPSRLRDALEADRPTPDPVRLAPTDRDFYAWCRAYVEVRGQRFSLEGHEYLRELYIDRPPWTVYEKAAQVGVSTLCVLEALYLCDRYGAKPVYYLSTDEDADDFSKDRVRPVIETSERLQLLMDERERRIDNAGLRQIGQGSLYTRGLFTRRQVKSVDADAIYLDELDEANQENKELAYDRILHSPLQYVRELSQPSIEDYGIDEAFHQTDQRLWHMQCAACKAWNCFDLHLEERDGRLVPQHFLTIPVRLKNASWVTPGQQYYRACLDCHQPLHMAQGEWVAQYPETFERRGYRISQLYRQQPMAGFSDPADGLMDKLLTARNTRQKKRVTISLLGRPYGGDTQPVDDAVLNACEIEQGLPDQASGCVMGLDQGDDLHIVVGRPTGDGRLQILALVHTEDWEAIARVEAAYGVVCAIGDAMPNKKSMKDEARRASYKFYIQYFRDTPLREDEEGAGHRAVRKVTVDRTESLDETVAQLKQQQILLPSMAQLGGAHLQTYELFRSQCKKLVKDLVEGANGVLRWEYKKNVANHFGMALNSMRLAWELYTGLRVDYDQLASTGIKIASAQGPDAAEPPDRFGYPAPFLETGLHRPSTPVLEAFSYG